MKALKTLLLLSPLALQGNTPKETDRVLRYVTEVTPVFPLCEDICPTHPDYVWFTTKGPNGEERYRIKGREARDWYDAHKEGKEIEGTYQSFHTTNRVGN